MASDRFDTSLAEETHELGHHVYSYREGSGEGFDIIVSRMYDDKVGIWCEVSVDRTFPDVFGEPVPPRQILPPNRTNLLGTWKKLIAEMDVVTEKRFHWDVMIEEVVTKTVSNHRDVGELNAMPDIWHDTKLEDIYLLPPFIVKSGVSVLFATGGTGKSTLAAAIGIAVAAWQPIWGEFPTVNGNVLYLDYESTQEALWRNMFALLKGFEIERDTMPHTLFHEAMSARIVTDIHRIRELVKKTEAKLVILDSIGMARGGDAKAADDTIAMFRALNSLNVPVLALDHTTKADRRDGTLLTPYGSQYTENSARVVWGMQEVEDESVPLRRVLTMLNTKLNVGVKHAPCSMVMEYINNDEGMTDIIKTEVGAEILVSKKQTTMDAVVRVMKDEEYRYFTLRELQMRTGLEHSALEKTMQRNSDKFTVRMQGKSNSYRQSWVVDRVVGDNG
jgi:hypothetical protein